MLPAPTPPIELDPGWRRALRTFLEAAYGPGDIVPILWLERELGVPHFEEGTQCTEKQWNRKQLHWVRHFERLRSALLEQHQIWLERDRKTEGYRVLVGSAHLRFAHEEGERRLAREAQRMHRQLINVRVDALSAAEQTTLTHEIAHVSTLKAFLRPRRLGASQHRSQISPPEVPAP